MPQQQTPPLYATKPSPTEETVTVTTDLYSAVFSSRGGTLKSFRLKKHKDIDGKDVDILDDRGEYPALGVGWKDDFSLSSENFTIRGQDLTLGPAKPEGSISFEFVADKISIRRTYTFKNKTYAIGLKDETYGWPEYQITLGDSFGISNKKEKYSHVGPVLLQDVERTELKGAKLKKSGRQSFKGNAKWIALEDKYFFSAIVPLGDIKDVAAWSDRDINGVIALRSEPGVNEFIIYGGPKVHEELKALGKGLEHIIDYGFFSIISRPLMWGLKKLYSIVGNYGFAIILLTIIIRIPFIPLVNKGQKSMNKMKELGPMMKELKEKHKKNPEHMNKEVAALYKRHKVNPIGGCLPMLLQIPVFFALYKVLLMAIELRGAPFVFWITDLSLKDPYYVLPLVMGASMFLQQKMTPSTADPKQQKIMMLMPVVFTFMFLNFASGLVLYWFVNNLLSMAQQIYVNKQAEKEKAEKAAAAAA